MPSNRKSEPYRVSEWGNGYFAVDAEGHLRVGPDDGPKASLGDIAEAARERGLDDPLILRFPQILARQQARIRDAFRSAAAEYGYTGGYQGVFPVKVNHDRTVVETLLEAGRGDRFGIEVGSKAELCLGLTLDLHPEAFIICNGFKDKDYLRLAVHASRHGRRVLVIVENPQEVEDIIDTVTRLGHRVSMGFRTRLHAEGTGRWRESTGHKGKFGLSSMEMLEAIDRLDAAGLKDDLKAVHFHIGSQVCDILNLKGAIKEGTRVFCALKARVPGLDVLDIGGGLGIDYDGSRSATDWSVNYSIEEYARDAVYMVKTCCNQAKVEPPVIVSESGRALTAYHAVIVLSTLRQVGHHEPCDYSRFSSRAQQIEDLKATLQGVDKSNFREAYHDATQLLNELLSGFKLGYVSLEERAMGECLHRDICVRVQGFITPSQRRTPDMIDLEKQLAPKYVCNFSVFMSAPDSWALGQLFPICPFRGLYDTEKVRATIGDITCDSDGKVEHFIGSGVAEPFLMLPAAAPGQQYLGMFLTGAYQDVLGDFHNLFGTANEAVVEVLGEDDFRIVSTDEASSVEHSLDQFGFTPNEMVRAFDRMIDRRQDRDDIQSFKGVFLRVLHGTTYLQS